MSSIADFLLAFWQVMLELAPSLLLGLLIAGLMHVYLPTTLIHRGLGQANLRSVARASLLGVPMPLCSCGVIPTALGLRREGASKGATVAFMISTPQTGADALLVSAAFLGWPFALFALVATFASGLIGGLLVNRLTDPDPEPAPAAPEAGPPPERPRGPLPVLRYAILDLLGAIDLWILAGVAVAALIGLLVPADYFAAQPWSQGVLGMLAVLAIALPLYVCTTGSVPVAASLVAAGLPAGSALVFLMAGPATNVATIGAVLRVLGGRVLAIYLGTIVVLSLAFGLAFDWLLAAPGGHAGHAHAAEADWIDVVSALTLAALLLFLSARRLRARLAPPPAPAVGELALRVEGMSCQHCVASVKRALEGCETVEEAMPDLASGLVRIRGRGLEPARLAAAVEQAGFRVAGSPERPPERP